MTAGAGLDVLLGALGELGRLRRDRSGRPTLVLPDGREVVLLLDDDDWDDLASGVVHTAESAVAEVLRIVATSTAPRAYLVEGQYTVWLSPYDPGRR